MFHYAARTDGGTVRVTGPDGEWVVGRVVGDPHLDATLSGRMGLPVRVRAEGEVPRCRMIDIDQDGATARGRWLTWLAAERDMFLAVYADVRIPGRIRLGDTVEVT